MKVIYSKSGSMYYASLDFFGFSSIPIGGIVAVGDGRMFRLHDGSLGRFLLGVDYEPRVFMELSDAKKALKSALRSGSALCLFPALQSTGKLFISTRDDVWVMLADVAPEYLISSAVCHG